MFELNVTKTEKMLKDFKCKCFWPSKISANPVLSCMFCLQNMRVTLLCCIEIFYSNLCLESEILKYKTEDLSGYIVVTAGKHL